MSRSGVLASFTSASARAELALGARRGLLAVRGDHPLVDLAPDRDAHARLAVERGHLPPRAAHFLCTGRPFASRHTTWFRRPWVGVPRPQNAHFIIWTAAVRDACLSDSRTTGRGTAVADRDTHSARCGARSYHLRRASRRLISRCENNVERAPGG